MKNLIFTRAIFFSLLGHLAIFGVFSFSFGKRAALRQGADIHFWGAILSQIDFKTPIANRYARFIAKADTLTLGQGNKMHAYAPPNYSLKPAADLPFSENKFILIPKPMPLAQRSFRGRDSALFFYPRLPYHFLLYFQDRQIAHIEFIFNITQGDLRDNITVKRKISSGNLEVDLLSKRYIERYLLMQHSYFALNVWQPVKIDLTAAND